MLAYREKQPVQRKNTPNERSIREEIWRANDMKKQDPKRALAMLDAAVRTAQASKIFINMAIVCGIRSQCHRYRGDNEEAIRAAQAAVLFSECKDAKSFSILSQAYLADRQYGEAIDAAKTALEISPDDHSYGQLIKAHLHVIPEKALRIAKARIDQKTGKHEYITVIDRILLAKSYLAYGNESLSWCEKETVLEDALRAAEQAYDMQQNSKTICLKADILRKLKRCEDALATLRGVYSCPNVILAKAYCHLDMNAYTICYNLLCLAQKRIREHEEKGYYACMIPGYTRYHILIAYLYIRTRQNKTFSHDPGSALNAEQTRTLASLLPMSENFLLKESTNHIWPTQKENILKALKDLRA